MRAHCVKPHRAKRKTTAAAWCALCHANSRGGGRDRHQTRIGTTDEHGWKAVPISRSCVVRAGFPVEAAKASMREPWGGAVPRTSVIMRVTGAGALRGAAILIEASRGRLGRSRGPLRSDFGLIVPGLRSSPCNDRAKVQVGKKASQQARILTQISADARGCTQMERNASQAVDDTPGRRTWLAESQQQGERQAGCPGMVGALGAMRVVQCLHGLQPYQKRAFDRQAHEVLGNHRAIMGNRGAASLRDGESPFGQRVGQRTLMGLYRKSYAERIEHDERAADDVPRQLIQPVLICVHPRASAYICVKTCFLLRRCRQTTGKALTRRRRVNPNPYPCSSVFIRGSITLLPDLALATDGQHNNGNRGDHLDVSLSAGTFSPIAVHCPPAVIPEAYHYGIVPYSATPPSAQSSARSAAPRHRAPMDERRRR